jgi:hypothetical protein
MRLRVHWISEGICRGTDELAGATIWQLTSLPVISHDIYGEQIYSSTDGSRVAFLRAPYGKVLELWICDLPTKQVALIGETVGVNGIASSPFLDSLYYVRPVGNDSASNYCLTRLNLKTLEQEDVFTFTDCPLPISGTISPDERFFVGGLKLRGNLYGLYRIDLERGTREVFHEKEDIFNPHLQFEPSEGRDILVQWNRGGIVDEDGNIVRLVREEGATLYVIDRDGENFRPLPVGKPYTRSVTGHELLGWQDKTSFADHY